MITELLLKEVKKKLAVIDSPTLEDFLGAAFISVEDCSNDTGIRIPTLYHVWKGKKAPSRANEKLLKAYTYGLVSWDHL